jgi:formyl-CoA transferase
VTDKLPLDGVRVLDFSRVLAGPLGTMLLGDMGADVIKIESPLGDETRHWGPPWAEAPDGTRRHSAYYLSVNRSKRDLVLDLKQPEAQTIARDLAARSHVLVENLKPGGMAHFGLGYDDLHPVNPALVYASISGFGQTGPYRERPGYDHVIQAMSGLMSITGPAEGPPYKVGVAIADVITGLFAASSILAALRHAEATGQGQHLDIALLDTTLAALVNVASNVLISGSDAPRHGNAHPSIAPYQVFEAADGPFVVAVGNDGQFAALCGVLDRPDLLADERYATNAARVTHRDVLAAEISRAFGGRTVSEWVQHLLAAGVPAGPINTVGAALDDPQVAARGLIGQMPLADGTLWRYLGMPVGFSETPPQVHRPPPLPGQHSVEILRELPGMDDARIADLMARGVVGSTPD